MTISDMTQALAYADVHRSAQADVHRIAGGLTDAQFNWKPDPASWSVAECLAHLNLVAEAYLPRLEAAVTRKACRAAGPFVYGFLARKMMEGVQPGGLPLRASAALDPAKDGPTQSSPGEGTPRSSLDHARVLASFDACAERYVAVCERADGLDLTRIKVQYPFMRMLRLPLGALLHITGAHALRHVAQAERVTEYPGFPAPGSTAGSGA